METQPTAGRQTDRDTRPSTFGRPTPAVDNRTHLLDHFTVIYRYRYISTAVFILTVLAFIMRSYTAVPLYRATVRLEIEDERSTAVPGFTPEDAYIADSELYFNTQYRILNGLDLARRVVRKMHLETVSEFHNAVSAPVSVTSLLHRLRARVFPSPASETPRDDEASDESLVSAFLGRVQVDPIRASRLVDVVFESTDPKFARLAVNTLADEYVDHNLEVRLKATDNMLKWLSNELAVQQKKVEDSERGLTEYREKQNAMSLEDRQNIVVSRLNQLNDEVTKAKAIRIQKEALYHQAESIGPGGPVSGTLSVIAQNPAIQNLKAKLTDLGREKARLAERYGEKHPEIIKINASMRDTQHQLDVETAGAFASVRNDYEQALAQERTLAGALEEQKDVALDLSRKSINYGSMERDAKSNRQLFESLLQKQKELSVSSNSRTNNVRVVDRAAEPRAPIRPGGRTWLLSSFIGLVFAVGVALGLDYMNDTIKTPEDVARRLKLPLLGLVPSVRGGVRPVLTSTKLQDFSEAFLAMRTSLMFKYAGTEGRIMMVTSTQPLEGKTTIACNIAIALAASGARVLLIDADMRRPGLHRSLRLHNERGLSNMLTGRALLRDVIQRTVDPNLLVIPAGNIPPDPGMLLASERMRELLVNLSGGPFDWIIVDTPPILAVTDAMILAPLVSGVTFVVGSEMTRPGLAHRALETLMESRPRFVAVVLNKVDVGRNKYYYSRYHGHQYKSYYTRTDGPPTAPADASGDAGGRVSAVRTETRPPPPPGPSGSSISPLEPVDISFAGRPLSTKASSTRPKVSESPDEKDDDLSWS